MIKNLLNLKWGIKAFHKVTVELCNKIKRSLSRSPKGLRVNSALIGQSAMGYCSGKPTADKPLGMRVEHSKNSYQLITHRNLWSIA